MRHRLGQSTIHIQFGKAVTDAEGDGGILLDTMPAILGNTAVVLTPDENVSATAFELATDTYHVTVSTQDAVVVNYVSVSAE